MQMKNANLPANFFKFDFKYLAVIVHKSNRVLHRWLNKLSTFRIDGLNDKVGEGQTLYLSHEKEIEFKNCICKFLLKG